MVALPPNLVPSTCHAECQQGSSCPQALKVTCRPTSALPLAEHRQQWGDFRFYGKWEYSIHHDDIFNFCPDVRPEDAQVLIQLSSQQRLCEGIIHVLSENHLAVLLERLPPTTPGVPAGVRAVKQVR